MSKEPLSNKPSPATPPLVKPSPKKPLPKRYSQKSYADYRRRLEDVEERRQAVEAKVEALQTSVQRELRWLPQGKKWWLPIAAFASGMAAVAGVRARRARGKS